MIIKTISYGFTKNLGNSQSERLDITAELDHNDEPSEVIDSLKFMVHRELQVKTKTEDPPSPLR
jgi:hypothetical protein